MSGVDDLAEFERDVRAAAADVIPLVKKAVGISALKGKKAYQAAVRGHGFRGADALAASIDYDPVRDFSTELGPNLGGKGAAGLAIVEESPGGVRGAPQRNYVKAQEAIDEDLPRGIEIALDQAMRRNRL